MRRNLRDTWRSVWSVVLLGLLTALGFLMLPMGSSAASDGGDDVIDIVLVGDSFSAGNGAGSYVPDLCPYSGQDAHRSLNNWAERYADMLRLDGYDINLTNEACSGAVTANMTDQMGAVGPGTDLVLLTIGGNDVKFSLIVLSCFALRAPLDVVEWATGPWRFGDWAVDMTQPLWCKSQIDAARAMADPTSGLLRPRVEEVFADLKDRGLSDDATVILLSYPYLELGSDMFEWYPVGQEVRSLGDVGDSAQAAAVADANAASTSGDYVIYNDTIKARFAGHEPDGSPYDRNPERWLHEFLDVTSFTPDGIVFNDWEAYHPNPSGQNAYAEALYDMDLFAEPPSLGRIDVTFVVDATSSMSADLAELQTIAGDVVTQLDNGTDTFKLGVVSFRDDPASTGIGTDYLSRLDEQMTKGGSTFASGVNGLSAVGGGGGDDTVYSGLVEAAGQPEHSRAKRVILHIGDSSAHDPEPVTGLTSQSTLDELFSVGSMAGPRLRSASRAVPMDRFLHCFRTPK